MDEIVKQALAKWPNVPHCYGWLALDARGAWRMRDERAQQLNLPGDRLTQPALVGFINRNYASDERGCWYFQNGPQRVYVDLEATPYIARTDPEHGLLMQTGAPLGTPDGAWLSAEGILLLRRAGRLAQLDDRDLAEALQWLTLDGWPLTDDTFLKWLAGGPGAMQLHHRGAVLTLGRADGAALEGQFGFIRRPRTAHAAGA